MSSPNEPGAPKGDSPNGEGVGDRAGAHRAATGPGRIPDAADSPPWQRGSTRAPQAQRPPAEQQGEGRSQGPPSSLDERLNRFISGGAAPASGGSAVTQTSPQSFDPAAVRGDASPADTYASELPDLSGPSPRTPQRPAAPGRTSETGAGSGTAAGTSRSETPSENRETRVQVARRGKGPVRASMQIRRIDPWSTLKVSLMLSVALFFVWMIAVAFLYLVLGGMGVWAKLNSNVGDLLNNTSGSSGELVSSGTIFGGAVLIGLVNIVLMTAMATIAAFIYNLTTDLIGGVEVTLADRD